MNQSVKTLGRVVRKARKSKNLSQEILADRVKVCKRTIIDIENNAGNPKFQILCRLVKELDLPLYQLFYPEMSENFEIKNVLIQEINSCTESEMNMILVLIRALKSTLKNNQYARR